MNLKVYKPINASTRGLINIDRSGLWKGRSEKSLTVRMSRTGGRNHYGRITVRHKGGGAKKMYRMVDFRREAHDGKGKVLRIEYDPNRSAFIALVEYADRKKYIIAPDEVKDGSIVGGDEIRPGSCVKLENIPSGTKVHNLELRPGIGARIVRAAGTFARVLGLSDDVVSVRLPSGQTRKLSKKCTAVIGSVSNPAHMHVQYAKAGRKRWLGRRPRVRGVVMNPVDHPMGGGEGRASGGHPRSRKGLPAKGYKTRSKTKSSNRFIIDRRKK